MDKKPIIEFKDFTMQYLAQSEPTLKNINLQIYPGEKVLIVGASGSGKSTIGHCINGLIPHAYPAKIEGELVIDKCSKNSIFERSKQIGTLLQDSDAQFVGLNVAEDIAFALENDCIEQTKMREIVSEVADVMELTSLLDIEPHELSGGQKQRVALAGVLVDDVEVLLCDEPLANLDPATGTKTIALLDEIFKQQHKTIIIIEHRIEDVFYRHIDKVVVMNEGEIVGTYTMEEILKNNVLTANGLREPLYITALKYANVDLNKVTNLANPETIQLNEELPKLIEWHNNQQPVIQLQEEPLLAIKHLSFSYDERKPILTNINFEVNKGEMLVLVGKNGAGKSTLSKLILGFEKLDEGQIVLSDKDLVDDTITMRAKKIGVVLQSPSQMISKAKIYDEVALGLRNAKVDPEEIDKRVEKILKVCGLLPYRNWPISALSFGQKKRVCIASILVMEPDILILDEPTAGQDYHHYHEIMQFLKELNSKGQTIILITHDMHLMLEYAKRAIVLADGKVIKDDKVYNVLNDLEVVRKANLKETSLYYLAQACGLEASKFSENFINFERGINHER